VLLAKTDDKTTILGAHAGGDPRLSRTALLDLEAGLESIFDKTGAWSLAWFRPDVYPTPVRRYEAGQLEILTKLFP